MVDVFLSYSREDQEFVRQMADRIGQLGYQVWWDADLPAHRSYGEVITEKIQSAKAGIVFWSGSAVESEWVLAEADEARNQKKLIQVSVDGTVPPMPFNMLQFTSLADWQGEDDHHGWQKIQNSLAELCERPVTQAGSPDGPAMQAAAGQKTHQISPTEEQNDFVFYVHPPRSGQGLLGTFFEYSGCLSSVSMIAAIVGGVMWYIKYYGKSPTPESATYFFMSIGFAFLWILSAFVFGKKADRLQHHLEDTIAYELSQRGYLDVFVQLSENEETNQIDSLLGRVEMTDPSDNRRFVMDCFVNSDYENNDFVVELH